MGCPKGSKNKSKGSPSSNPQPPPAPATPSKPQRVPPPATPSKPTNHHVQWGMPINPVLRLRIMSPAEWEMFIREWAESLKSEYHDVQPLGGSGDQGRDVIGYVTDKPDPWDNYQCKHYDAPLTPGDAVLELAKLCYYTFINEFTVPRRYYFVAPQGVGTSLGKLIDKPEELRKELIQAWPKRCESKITKKQFVKLEGPLLRYVQAFDFSIIKRISVGKIIEQHRATPYHVIRFGGGLPPRPAPDTPPDTIGPQEARYVTQLVEAYSEHVGRPLASVAELTDRNDLIDHFKRCREHFYCAESLRNFSRELLPANEFGNLQDDVYDGVIDICNSEHGDGYARVRETVKEANRLHLSSHTLISCTRPRDLSGICHQLANDARLEWVQKP